VLTDFLCIRILNAGCTGILPKLSSCLLSEKHIGYAGTYTLLITSAVLSKSALCCRLPYRTYDTDKGGNAALMAPEVALAVPGTFTSINYAKVRYIILLD
jgi:hypothetical protein